YNRENENTLSNNYIITIYQDSSGIVWIGTLRGLNRFDKKTGEFTRFFFDPDEENSLSNNTILTITESILDPGVLWIGTDDGGLNRFDVKKGIFNRYLEKDGLPGNVVNGILEDDNGFLWLSTNGGLSKFDPASKTFRNYKKSSGIEGLGFIRNSSLKSGTGELYFGSITGMISFFPEDVKDNSFVPRIVITSFKKLGEEIKTKKPLRYNDEIRLSYKENFISFEFAALDYTNVKENRYSYFFKGVDYSWIKSGSTRFASYNHLSPGNYLFSVKGSNNDGKWSEKGASLKIVIVPAYWQTLWFRIIVISLVFFLIALFYRMRVNRITRSNRKLSEINLSLSREIKNRRDAEEALRESEESYKTLFLSANDSIFLLKDGVFVKCNVKTPQLFGFRDESGILGQSVVQFSPELQPDGQKSSHFNEYIKNALCGETQRFNWTFIKEDGASFDTEISLNKLEIGKQLLIQVILRDITEQKKLQERLAVTQKMESIGELVGGIAHDFNNILTAVNGYAEMALQKIKPDKREYRIVNNILKSGKQAVDLVQKLLGFSRKQIIKPKVIDINDAIRELNDILVRLIGEDIEIEYFLKEGIRPIKADHMQIEQIIINLCINSRDAINQKTHKASRKKIVVETNEVMISDEFLKSHIGSATGKHILISVSDNGVGMKSEIKERIFEPFFTTKSFGKGTGLGLSTVYGIVKQNKGSIYIYSEDGEGTTVKIYWPVSREKKFVETITSEVEK
ncbi:MAG: PAS domain S-box protein, partial [Candidatus Aminicenantes bacterium]|nr:PAS domain S-box protein [Candidatus Aminicenantes bacterium]